MTITQNIPDRDLLLCDVNALAKPVIISLVGAGGKTSTLFWLAGLFCDSGRRVLITTTTQMYMPDPACPVTLCRDPAQLPADFFQSPLMACFSGWSAARGKVRGFSPELIDRLIAQQDLDVILIEADGARGFALKAPAEHEPCIPQSSRCVIGVTGGGLSGKPVGPDNVHRWAHFAAITGLNAGDRLDLPAMRRLVQHPQGLFKGAPPGCRRIWFINRVSHFENQHTLKEMLEANDVDVIWQGAVQETPPITRRVVR
ncbi:selenium cofactor biosynthesis protein YqeC [Atlantibacter sp. RC6]|uniref:selenium cofactor biosynthesis protein YqeC n=1 Tax=Atlantibacter sp. RC6 TaxID=2587036 RepID=UPI0016061443|nr:selenium cofactor biosynthesis protein YqeC [Atlantibacter sp. RC6]MBB3322369.1 putative selenium-dependent hydroxylase accessory protein YqeC [Atlantibacter sp. RC6]